MNKNDKKLLIVITGPTATGKTRLAARVAHRLDGEIISADSRQVYRGMDIGTGKDREDYHADEKIIASHLIDIHPPGYEYNVYEFQKDFLAAFEDIISRNKLPVLCGGTGLYVEAAISGYKLIKVPQNDKLRSELDDMPTNALVEILGSMKKLHNTTDITDRNRLIRAIEIARHEQAHQDAYRDYPAIRPIIFAIEFERDTLRRRITERLTTRLDQGMVEEVRKLLADGLSPAQLKFYGLEYRFVTDFVTGDITYDEMFDKLNTAIHQFAKRQMTWFRRMERKGHEIHWIDGGISEEDKTERVISIIYGNTNKEISSNKG